MTYSGSIKVNVRTLIKTAKTHMLSSFFGTIAASSSIIKRAILKKKTDIRLWAEWDIGRKMKSKP